LRSADSDTAKIVLISLAVGLVLGGAIGYLASQAGAGGDVEAGESVRILSPDEIGAMTEAYINQNLLRPGMSMRVENVTKRGGVFEVQVTVAAGDVAQKASLYVSKDGVLLFPDAIDMSAPRSPSQGVEAPPDSRTDVDMRALIDDDPWAGKREAKVIVVEFSDFQCPFCAKMYPSIQRLIETYGDRILFVYRDFPLSSIHPQAQKAAESAQCAFEQGRFWEYHDRLFERQEEWASLGIPKFREYAADLGLDTERFNECLDSGKYAAEVAADLREGERIGVSATPTYFINGRKLTGALPYSTFQGVVEEALSQTG
jgi:protein-disulfide isomerase